ncbi:Mor transcription activator family protein [Lacticaseibacillus saniviri]|uniref:Mor transcription activator family protein n=1 Tax=Lacticaseibacillus saniviri TaxID=931533 RepID=UPI0006D013F4|nr:Mor transcription activator family protein [Lacticaseibacillus saniviri]
MIKSGAEVEISVLHQTYQRLAELVGVDNMLKIYSEFRGLQIQFPMRMYDRDAVGKRIAQEYNGGNLKALSDKYDYSQRWIYQQIKTYKQNETWRESRNEAFRVIHGCDRWWATTNRVSVTQ